MSHYRIRLITGVLIVTLAGGVFAQSFPSGSSPSVAPERIRNAMESYVRLLAAGDTDGIMNLYGENPSFEDPVGDKPLIGRKAIRAAYTQVGPIKAELVGPVVVAGLEGAMRMSAELKEGNGFIDVIETMKFDNQGKIVSLRAYWSFAEIRSTRLSVCEPTPH